MKIQITSGNLVSLFYAILCILDSRRENKRWWSEQILDTSFLHVWYKTCYFVS